MTFEIEAGGRTFTVAVERTDRPGQYRVSVDGVSRLVGVSKTGDFGLSLLTAAENGEAGAGADPEAALLTASMDFQVVPGAAPGEVLVGSRGRTVAVSVNGRRSAHADGALHAHGAVTIVAPMPGRVVRVLAAAGEDVAARQPVVVVEAMKMENELRAPRAGRIKEIAVAPGTSVEAGRVLAVIE